MKSVRMFLLEKNVLIRIILSYLFIGLLVIGALTLLITAKVSESLKEELTASTDRALEQSYNTASILLSSSYQHFANAYSSADIQAGFYAGEFDTGIMGRIGSNLTDLVNTNPMVHSVYLVNTRQQLVFSSLTTVREFRDFYDQQILQLLEHTDTLRGSIFIPRNTSFVHDTKRFEGNLISIAYMSTRDDKVINGAMVVNLDQQLLQNMIMNGAGSKSFQSMILNRQGTVISHTDHQMINTDLSGVGVIQSILQSNTLKGTIEAEMDGTSHRFFYIKSDSLGWIFVGDVNYENLLSKVNTNKRYMLTVTGAMLFIVALSGFFFTRMIYGPIHRLIKSLGVVGAQGDGGRAANEFDLLSEAFRYLERKVRDLQTSVAGYQYNERREVLRQLTTGGWSSEAELMRIMSQMGIELPSYGFQVCMLRLDSYMEMTEEYSPSDLSLLKYAVTNIADEVGTAVYPTYSFDGGEDRVVILFLKPEGMEDQLQHLIRDIQKKTEQYVRLSVSASIGQHAANLQQVPKSWQSAYNHSRYRLIGGRGCLIPADFEQSREPISDSLSTTMEKLITDSMKLGVADKTIAALKEYFNMLRGAHYEEVLLLLNQLLFTVTRTAKSMASGDLSGFSTDIGTLGQQLYKWETLEQVEEWFAGLVETAISLRDKQSSLKNVLIVEKLKQHIHERYADPNLTVEALAEVAGLSVNYLRKIYKDMTGISINHYITEFRFEKAKELLLSTDLPANKIGEMVGCDNAKYFYISFKKYSGKTPDHFRKSSNDERMLLE
ncbi:helix-turn-helix domain-containing protein [Bacillus sp. 3255]|uniref:helix-turn-helix domain-containing protein n=1 Tax=Bacillus sp. 3255 TaxID=2817904 RepID=UPI002858F0B9|nr:helix-turn-helix domain-containing protein [Bacillus sp. 3255]MDR6879586.1 AraC-like DNA-binding protein [Bacillus sp. 3255]